MYIYYEITPGPFLGNNDPDTLTEVILSSDGKTSKIDWKNKRVSATANFITSFFKNVSVANRSMDDSTYLWTFLGSSGPIVIEHIKSMISQGLLENSEAKAVTDILERIKRNRLDLDPNLVKSGKNHEVKFKEEDFFYKPEPSSNGPSGEQLYSSLAAILEVSVDFIKTASPDNLKRSYRKAALKHHPDRNNGNDKMMTELNYLWNIFNSSSVRV